MVPKANDGLAGVTASDTSTGAPTFSVAEAVIAPDVAVIIAAPMPAPVANPVLDTVAAPAEELQLTRLVTSCMLPLL